MIYKIRYKIYTRPRTTPTSRNAYYKGREPRPPPDHLRTSAQRTTIATPLKRTTRPCPLDRRPRTATSRQSARPPTRNRPRRARDPRPRLAADPLRTKPATKRISGQNSSRNGRTEEKAQRTPYTVHLKHPPRHPDTMHTVPTCEHARHGSAVGTAKKSWEREPAGRPVTPKNCARDTRSPNATSCAGRPRVSNTKRQPRATARLLCRNHSEGETAPSTCLATASQRVRRPSSRPDTPRDRRGRNLHALKSATAYRIPSASSGCAPANTDAGTDKETANWKPSVRDPYWTSWSFKTHRDQHTRRTTRRHAPQAHRIAQQRPRHRRTSRATAPREHARPQSTGRPKGRQRQVGRAGRAERAGRRRRSTA